MAEPQVPKVLELKVTQSDSGLFYVLIMVDGALPGPEFMLGPHSTRDAANKQAEALQSWVSKQPGSRMFGGGSVS